MFMEERKNTGRVYLMNVDANDLSCAFKPDVASLNKVIYVVKLIRSLNLCIVLEIKKEKFYVR